MELPIIIYDSECPLCVRFKKALSLMDKNNSLSFVSLDDETVYQVYPFLNQEECSAAVHLVDEEMNVYVGGDVITYLIKFFPLVKKLSWLIDNKSSKKAIDAFYGQIDSMRKMKKKNCFRCGK